MRLLAAFVVTVLFLFTPYAANAEFGSPAWSLRQLVLKEGPGNQYDDVGLIDPEVRVYVDRCSRNWCRVHRGHQAGWTSLYSITFGVAPHSPYAFPHKGFAFGGPGEICLYEGPNYTGAALCAKSGFKARDLLLLDADNLFSSVSIKGKVSVLLCRDRDFHSYCVIVSRSQPRLHGFLDNGLSSLHVY